uniref:Uncharacterized protein n=1 Tax=Manihot esculenta TaxID=3983 RepID=A0A2C9U3G4_MANES
MKRLKIRTTVNSSSLYKSEHLHLIPSLVCNFRLHLKLLRTSSLGPPKSETFPFSYISPIYRPPFFSAEISFLCFSSFSVLDSNWQS